MEFPTVGAHCSAPSCNQLDFLPFTCDGCHKSFCKDHFTPDFDSNNLLGHQCSAKRPGTTSARTVPTCPICSQPVPVRKGEDPNLRMDIHIRNGCQKAPQTVTGQVYNKPCAVPSCASKNLVTSVCKRCSKQHCLTHRLESAHKCTGAPLNKAAATMAAKASAAQSKPTSQGLAAFFARKPAAAAAATASQQQQQKKPQPKRPAAASIQSGATSNKSERCSLM